MKRWFFIVVAALVVLLSYPSTHALAGSESDISKPRILTPLAGGEPIALSGETDGDGDGGDADGLAGIANQKTNRHSGPDASAEIRVMIQVWWKFLIWLR